MKNGQNLLLLIIMAIALGSGCTGTVRLKDGERLYAGAKVKIIKTEKSWSTKVLKTDLKKAVILPRPNKKILWMRPRLVIYHAFHNSRPKSVGNFIANRFGEEPVELTGGLKPEVNYVGAHGFDQGWTTNMPLAEFMARRCAIGISS